MALLVVLVLTVLIAIAAYEFTFYMESQYRASRVHEEQTQARLSAMSGLELAAAMLELSPADRNEQGGIVDNSNLFAGLVCESLETSDTSGSRGEADNLWRSTLVSSTQRSEGRTTGDSSGSEASRGPNGTRVRFGMVNESAKLHIPTLLQWDQESPGQAESALMNLPGATRSSVQAWLKAVRQNLSGKSQSLSLLEKMQDAGSASSDRTISRDELSRLWYGADLNRNYRLDPMESQLLASADSMNQDATANSASGVKALGDNNADIGGWNAYLSWHNGCRNRSYIGQPRVDLNQQDLQDLQRQLLAVWPADWANFVIAYRQFGPSNVSNRSAEQAISSDQWTPDFGQSATFSITSPLDLVGSFVSVPAANVNPGSSGRDSDKQQIASPFQSNAGAGDAGGISDLLDEATTDPSPWIMGRVDISEASLPVLLGIPGVSESLAQRIVSQRANLLTSPEKLSTIAWLLEGSITLDELRSIEPFIAARSDVYSVQSVGFRDESSPFFRCTATLDATQTPARILGLRTWHVWGNGFGIEELSSTAQQ
jgi:hypothetical protein